ALRMERGNFAEAEEDLRRAVDLKPDGCQAYLDLAVLARRRNDDAAALRWLDEALARQPPPSVRAEAYANKGQILRQRGRNADALQACNEALRVRPDYAEVEEVRGEALLDLKDYAGADRAFTRCLELSAKPIPNAYGGRGYARAQLGQYAAAVQDYTLG